MAENNNIEKKIKGPKKLKLLVSIVERSKVDFYLQALEGYNVNLQTVTYARGTADNETLKHLGFIDNSKALIFSVVPDNKVKEILIAYEDRIYKTKSGKGLAFTIPFDSIIGLQMYQMLGGISFKEEL